MLLHINDSKQLGYGYILVFSFSIKIFAYKAEL